MRLDVDNVELPQISASARSYADVFRLPLKEQAWRGSVGEFAGSGVGSSLDFQDHRLYQPGDDPRHINWQAYARTGSYSMKLYREEVRPIIEIIFDVSDSTFLNPEKTTRALELFYFVNFAAMRDGASISNYLVKGENEARLELDQVASHQWVSVAETLPDTTSAAAPILTRIPFRPQSFRIFISDLLHPYDPEQTLREMIQKKGRGIILAPYSKEESDPAWNGNYEFIDVEDNALENHRVDRPLLTRYLNSYRRHFELWKSAGLKYQTPIARVAAEVDFEVAIRTEAVALSAIQM